jgi:Cdc6-like AAA superfamily ATPase
MRTIKTLLLVVALTFSSVLVASTNLEEKKTESVVITDEVGKLLKNPSFLVEKDVIANVTLIINKNNEIVVLSVDCDENYLVSFIKSRLNYNELPTSIKTDGKTFVVPVRITPEE